MNNIPLMPSLAGGPSLPDVPLSPSSAESQKDSAVGETQSSPEETFESLNPKPQIANSEEKSNTTVNLPVVPKSGIEVVATRKGFYNQTRIKEGVEFKIKSEEDFGDWFKCKDPVFEKRRANFIKEKKAKK